MRNRFDRELDLLHQELIEMGAMIESNIAAATDACVTIQPEGEDAVTIAFDDVKKCTLKPVFDFKGVKEGN